MRMALTYVLEYERKYHDLYYCSPLTLTTNMEILLATDPIGKFTLQNWYSWKVHCPKTDIKTEDITNPVMATRS